MTQRRNRIRWDDMPELLTTEDLAMLLRISRNRLYQHIAEIPAECIIKFGRRYRFSKEAVGRLLLKRNGHTK